MEHTKLIAMSLKCNICSRSWSVTEEDYKKTIIKCQDPECQNEFTVYEGLRNGLKMTDNFIPIPFLSNDMFQETIDVKIGYSLIVPLPDEIKKVFKINLFPIGQFIAGATEINNHAFQLMTSLHVGCDPTIIGDESKVIVMVHAKTSDYENPWLHMLAYALEQYQTNEYLTCILLSEIAFESYLDMMIAEGYRLRQLDEDSITRLLKSNIPDKANALMNNVFGIKLSKNKAVFDSWQRVLKIRNDIAHGRKSTATKDEAKFAYDTIVDATFHLIEGVDTFYRS